MAKRQSDWIDTLVSSTVSDGGQVINSLATGVAPVNQRGATIVRTIYELSLYSTTVAGAWGLQSLDIAWGVTSQEAFAAGVVPDPNTSGDEPLHGWMFRTRCLVAQNGAGTQIIYVCKGDSRSQRKIETGEPFWVGNSTNRGGTGFAMSVVGIIRQLWLLP